MALFFIFAMSAACQTGPEEITFEFNNASTLKGKHGPGTLPAAGKGARSARPVSALAAPGWAPAATAAQQLLAACFALQAHPAIKRAARTVVQPHRHAALTLLQPSPALTRAAPSVPHSAP